MSCVVIGCGLGRDPSVLVSAAEAMVTAARLRLPVVVDADGLFLLCSNPGLIHGAYIVLAEPNYGTIFVQRGSSPFFFNRKTSARVRR